MPYVAEILSNEDGHVALVRAETPAAALALAEDEAESNDMVVTDAEADIRVGWVRATPCRTGGHETRDGFEWCDGGQRCHYAYGKAGPGAFRAAFVNVRYLMPGERETPECSRPDCGTPVTGTPVSDPCDPLSRTWCSGECADADSEAAYAQRYGAGVAT